MRRNWPLLVFLIVPGIFGVVLFGYYALVDYAALRAAYANFERVTKGPHTMSQLFVAEARQNIHRINVFADGTWTR